MMTENKKSMKFVVPFVIMMQIFLVILLIKERHMLDIIYLLVLTFLLIKYLLINKSE